MALQEYETAKPRWLDDSAIEGNYQAPLLYFEERRRAREQLAAAQALN
jgi:hypothetical protein